MEKVREKWKNCYPPGYDISREWWGLATLLGLGFFLSLGYFVRLGSAVNRLYVWVGNERVLAQGAVAEPFLSLTEGTGVLFLPLALFTLCMIPYHYLYYFHETKSIYLMRRLPRRELILSSCVRAPGFCLLAEGLFVAALYLFYFGIYLLAVPPQCRPV
ncbi:MAG: hypothetical protein NC541_11525 [bacterium]|nr:hypothetical protein [bacterium]